MTKKNSIITLFGVLIGAFSGYAYYYFIGCSSGTCTITSKPINATLYGALMAGLLFNMFVSSSKK
jgi:hypothetical protein